MAQQIINIGVAQEDHTGDGLREGGDKINANLTELYATVVPYLYVSGAAADGVTDDTAAIQAAIDAANAAGSRIIIFKDATYYLAGTLVPKPGAILQGVPWTTTTAGVYSRGTRFLGNDSNDGIKWVPTTYSSQPTNGQIQAAAVRGFGVRDIAFDSFATAINAGGLYNSGFFRSEFRNILVNNATVWGVYFENCSQCTWSNIQTRVAQAGSVGGQYYGASHTAYTHGNSSYSWLYNTCDVELTRNVVFQTRAGAALNQVEIYQVQGSGFGTTVLSSQTCTLTNGSTSVTVSDSTRFKVDEPVGFTTAPGGGFGSFAYQSFFVTEIIDPTHIRLANTQRGAHISFTGSTNNFTILSFGFPCLEVSGYSYNNDPNPNGTSNSAFQAITLNGVDVEGAAGCQMLIQNAHINLHIDTVTAPFTGKGVTYLSNLCVRGCNGVWDSVYALNVDMDSGTAPFFTPGGYIASWVNVAPLGTWYDYALTQFVFNLSNSLANGTHTFINQKDQVTGKYFTYPEVPIGQCQNYSSSTSLALTPQLSGTILYSGAGAATWTLPQLTSGRGGAAFGNSAGMLFNVVNDSADGAALTLNAFSAAQPFGYRTSAKTSYSIPRGGSLSVHASWVAASSVFWSVLTINGAT